MEKRNGEEERIERLAGWYTYVKERRGVVWRWRKSHPSEDTTPKHTKYAVQKKPGRITAFWAGDGKKQKEAEN